MDKCENAKLCGVHAVYFPNGCGTFDDIGVRNCKARKAYDRMAHAGDGIAHEDDAATARGLQFDTELAKK